MKALTQFFEKKKSWNKIIKYPLPSNEPTCNCIQFHLCFPFDLFTLSLGQTSSVWITLILTWCLASEDTDLCRRRPHPPVPRWAKFAQHLAEHIGFSIFTQIVSKISETVGSWESNHKQHPCHANTIQTRNSQEETPHSHSHQWQSPELQIWHLKHPWSWEKLGRQFS